MGGNNPLYAHRAITYVKTEDMSVPIPNATSPNGYGLGKERLASKPAVMIIRVRGAVIKIAKRCSVNIPRTPQNIRSPKVPK